MQFPILDFLWFLHPYMCYMCWLLSSWCVSATTAVVTPACGSESPGRPDTKWSRSDHEVITKIMKCTYCTWTLLDAGSVKVCLSKSVCAPLCWEKGQKQSWSHSRWLRRHALSTFWWLKSEGPMYQWTNGPTKLIMNIFEHSYEHSYEVMDST